LEKPQRLQSRLKSLEQQFWFKYPIVAFASYIEVNETDIRHQFAAGDPHQSDFSWR
jgi:hypothetical protein